MVNVTKLGLDRIRSDPFVYHPKQIQTNHSKLCKIQIMCQLDMAVLWQRSPSTSILAAFFRAIVLVKLCYGIRTLLHLYLFCRYPRQEEWSHRQHTIAITVLVVVDSMESQYHHHRNAVSVVLIYREIPPLICNLQLARHKSIIIIHHQCQCH